MLRLGARFANVGVGARGASTGGVVAASAAARAKSTGHPCLYDAMPELRQREGEKEEIRAVVGEENPWVGAMFTEDASMVVVKDILRAAEVIMRDEGVFERFLGVDMTYLGCAVELGRGRVDRWVWESFDREFWRLWGAHPWVRPVESEWLVEQMMKRKKWGEAEIMASLLACQVAYRVLDSAVPSMTPAGYASEWVRLLGHGGRRAIGCVLGWKKPLRVRILGGCSPCIVRQWRDWR